MNKQDIQTNVVKPELKTLVGDEQKPILDEKHELAMDKSAALVEKYMKDNNGKGKPDEEKDNLYKEASDLLKDYNKAQMEAKYNFFLTRPQYNFLFNLLDKKMEYNVNTVFIAIELSSLLSRLQEGKYTNDTESIMYSVNATEITYIYHLISEHKVKGLSKESYMFAQVLRRIGDISKSINYYDTLGKNLRSDISNWVASFEPNVTLEQKAELNQE
jgi:hypothetical protein